MDGPKNQNSYTGYAFSIMEQKFHYRIPDSALIFTAELMAIFHCLLVISEKHETDEIKILTDSLISL